MKTLHLIGLALLTSWCVYADEPAPTPPAATPTKTDAIASDADVPIGPDVFAVFVGRTPCQGLARQMNIPVSTDCIKRKWMVVLHQDPATHAPTTYSLLGSGYRPVPRTGKWAIVKGTAANPRAIVYQLDPDSTGAFLSFLKVDDNVLLFLGRDGDPLVGNIYFSYALNRIVKR